MSFIVNQSLFPVVALNLGTTVTEDIKDKKVYKLTKHYFAVFCIKTPDRVYFIEGDDKVVIPKLSELIGQPCLHLGKSECEVPLPPFVVNNFVNFLKDPTIEISGFYLYDLFANGFITSDYFTSRIVGMLAPQLCANGIEIDSIDANELVKLAHKSQASKLGLSGDSLSLKDRLKAYVNHDNKPKIISPTTVNAVTFDANAVPVDDQESTINRQDSQTKDPEPSTETFDGDIDDSVSVNLSTMNKKDLLTYAKKLGLKGLSKKSVKQITDAITEKLTTPDPIDDNDDLYADLIDNSESVETEKELVTA